MSNGAHIFHPCINGGGGGGAQNILACLNVIEGSTELAASQHAIPVKGINLTNQEIPCTLCKSLCNQSGPWTPRTFTQ